MVSRLIRRPTLFYRLKVVGAAFSTPSHPNGTAYRSSTAASDGYDNQQLARDYAKVRACQILLLLCHAVTAYAMLPCCS
jgi:hypothetical protein